MKKVSEGSGRWRLRPAPKIYPFLSLWASKETFFKNSVPAIAGYYDISLLLENREFQHNQLQDQRPVTLNLNLQEGNIIIACNMCNFWNITFLLAKVSTNYYYSSKKPNTPLYKC